MKIVIDGNIGAGKTTQLGLLEKKGYNVKKEPIDKWPLKEFYEDPSRWAFLFHMRIIQTRRPSKNEGTVIYERSLQSSFHVFWKLMKNKGLVTTMEDQIYSYFYEKECWFPDLYIYLSKDPEKAFEHVRDRHQAGDDGVTLEYLKELDDEYKKLLLSIPCKVHVLNANRSVEEIQKDILRIIKENEVFLSHSGRIKVSKNRSSRDGKMQCTSFTNVCSVS